MLTFCSDLDNTLIYSYHRCIPEPKLPAEYLDGRILSYMTERTFRFLSQQKKWLFIPVTTRTEAQYKRIVIFQEQIPCRYALVSNGAVLLKDGVVQEDWQKETFRLGDAGFQEIRRLRDYMENTPFSDHMHYEASGMLYFVPEDTVPVEQFLLQCADTSKILICVNGRKVYCIPKTLTKGVAIQRLRSYLQIEKLISAGDSSMDVPMLNASDVALCPESIAEMVSAKMTIAFENVLSDQICAYLENAV